MIQSEFDKIYRSYFQYVYLYMLKLCKNEHLAEELTSETFFKAMSAMDKFQGKSSINTWLISIAKNTYYNYIKRDKRMVDEEQLGNTVDSKIDIEKQFMDTETALEIHRILHLLDDPYKEVFSLRVMGQLSFKQIADIYGKTENWACVTYYRAKNRIRSRLEESK